VQSKHHNGLLFPHLSGALHIFHSDISVVTIKEIILFQNFFTEFSANPNALFEQGTTISYTPNTFIEEGDNVIFQCIGDVGNEKAGHLGWFYYLGSNYTDPINASAMAISQATVFQPSTCSSKQASTLHLTMLRSFNNMIVRCTVQHDTYNEFGDGYTQTQNIPVYCKYLYRMYLAFNLCSYFVCSYG
jgi:hypothetical protein